MSRYLGIYMMIYFVFRKASKPLRNRKVWINWRIRPIYFISLIVNVAIIIFIENALYKINDQQSSNEARNLAYKKISCTSLLWISSATFEFLSVLIFSLFVMQL